MATYTVEDNKIVVYWHNGPAHVKAERQDAGGYRVWIRLDNRHDWRELGNGEAFAWDQVEPFAVGYINNRG